jgi:serine/threonine-protein kinase
MDRTSAVTMQAPPTEDLLRAGDLLEDKYRIERLLGSGGMGQVYAAHDTSLDRAVAIKLSWPHIEGDFLLREARVLAQLRHPGLVTVYATGRHLASNLLVMERIGGTPMSEYFQRSGALPIAEAIDLLLPICDTLAAIHEAGLAHCDLKPANIMLAPGGRVVLLDFGIARVEQIPVTERLISGSPHFMAPEAIRGTVRAGDAHLVDVYAAGIILFTALTGSPPYDHTDPVELMIQHLEQPVPRLHTRRRGLPLSLVELVASMMSKDPGNRPARIEAVRDILLAAKRRCATAGRDARREP